MASDSVSVTTPSETKPPMSTAEVVAYVRKELDIDDEHLARVITANSADLPRDAHSGVTLDLSHKNIRELPVEVVALIKDKVERLALSHNPQIAVPTQIIQCDRLRYLNLRWNQLKHFPEAILQLSKLEILDISKNRIVGIPEDIKRMASLKFLAVARNKITRLPLSLGEMGSLTKLKFDENPIEFPPPDALKPQKEKAGTLETEKEKDVCLQVKRYLRQAALRERLMTHSDLETSESNVETPRPPKRGMGMGGRFPVRPSISGIENITDLKSESPSDNAPPIPKRSHARMSSGTLGMQVQRPGIAPVHQANSEANRSRSETVSSLSNIRTRRNGFVPSKRTVSTNNTSTDLSSVNEVGSTRSSQATLKAAHSRNPSVASTYKGYLAPNGNSDLSSGAASPTDGPVDRYQLDRSVGQAMQHPNAKLLKSRPIIASKRLWFTLLELQRPLNRIAQGLKDGTPKRTMLERQLFNANAHVEELERLLHRLDSGLEDTPNRESAAAVNIATACNNGMKAYAAVVKELKGFVQKIVYVLDPVLIRCLMFQINTSIVEARNVCKSLGFSIVPPTEKQDTRASRAWSSRTVTPTQPKPLTNRRLRGPTILRSISSNSTMRAMPPPVPLKTSSSRTNTMTSIASGIPRSGDSFASASGQSSAATSRTNTMRNMSAEEMEEMEQFERIFLKLRTACDIANHALPHCHTEFTVHKDNAETAGKARAAHYWSLALSKCNAVIRANQALSGRLKQVKLREPGVRNQREFWQLCDAFVQVCPPSPSTDQPHQLIRLIKTWAELATEVKDIGQQRIDITTIKAVMKPVQRAIKDVSKSISDSPLYHAALRPPNNAFALSSPQSLAPPFPAGLNTALAQASLPYAPGPPTSVPATPLAAALGPAAQATLSYTSQPSGEYFPHSAAAAAAPTGLGVRNMHERLDTMMQHPGASTSGGGLNYHPQQQYQQHSSGYAGFPHTARRVDMSR
ncbi:hypothetical protein Q7P37_008778 [Cladosporium fusiforme]